MSRRSAFTLVETLVACSLLVLASTLLGSFFVFFSRQAARYETRDALLTYAERALFRVSNVLSGSSARLVKVGPPLLIPTAVPAGKTQLAFDDSGKLLWQSWAAFGLDTSTGVLWTASQALTPTNDVATILKGPTSAANGWTRRTLAANVSEFSVTASNGNLFRIQVVLEDRYEVQLELITSVAAPN